MNLQIFAALGSKLTDRKQTLSAKEVIADIRAGASDEFLMRKHGVSEKGLQSLFQKLVSAKVLSQSDLDRRASAVEEVEAVIIEDEVRSTPSASTLTQAVFRCPACNLPQNYEFKVCPQCGIIVEKFLRKKADRTVEKEPVKDLSRVVEQPVPNSGDAVDPTPPAKPTESLQGKLKRVGSQAVDKAKELSHKVGGSPMFAKVLEFLKVPRNAAVAGIAGTIIVIFIGHLILGRTDESKTVNSTVAQNATENITLRKAKEPGSRSNVDASQSPIKAPAPKDDPRNSTLPDSRSAVFPKMTSRGSTLPDADDEPSGYTTAPKDYRNQRQTASPPVQQFPDNRPRQQVAEKKAPLPQSRGTVQSPPKFTTFEEAKKYYNCKSGKALLRKFPDAGRDFADQVKEVKRMLSTPDPNYYYLYALYNSGDMENGLYEIVKEDGEPVHEVHASYLRFYQFALDTKNFSLSYNPTQKGGFPIEIVARFEGFLKIRHEFSTSFVPVFRPEVINDQNPMNGGLYVRGR